MGTEVDDPVRIFFDMGDLHDAEVRSASWSMESRQLIVEIDDVYAAIDDDDLPPVSATIRFTETTGIAQEPKFSDQVVSEFRVEELGDRRWRGEFIAKSGDRLIFGFSGAIVEVST